MKLQILVPHYRETADEMRPLLDSIALQQAVDFSEIGVVVAYDGPDAEPLPCEWFGLGADPSPYPFAIERVLIPEHVGVSATRNAALDAATADYVMFCDCDDCFCDACGLYIVFREIDNGGFDTMVSCFREETRDPDGNPLYVNHDMDSTFVHGKVHRRAYLVDSGIRFDPRLTVHEDSYFNILAQNLTQSAKYCQTPFYLWRWRDGSVCRHDRDYILKTYGNMLDSNDALVDEFVRRMREDKAAFYVAYMVYDAYYLMNKPEWVKQENQHYRKAVEERFARYFAKHRGQWESVPQHDRMMISNGVRQRSVMEGMLMEAVTLDQWLEGVMANA